MYSVKNPEGRRLEWETARIQEWLSGTSEGFDDWDWDGENLIIIGDDEVTEEYNRQTVEEEIFSKSPPLAEYPVVHEKFYEQLQGTDF